MYKGLRLPFLKSPFDDEALNIQNSGIALLNYISSGFDGTKLIEPTANLFNKAQAGYGAVHSVSGEVRNPDDGFRNTGFIPVEPDTTYRMNPTMGLGAMYDENYNYVGAINTAGDTIRTTDKTRYVRVSVSSGSFNTSMFYKGSEAKSFEEYGFKPSPLIIDDSSTSDGLTINRGKDYPIKSVAWSGNTPSNIHQSVKDAVLDAKVFGAIPGKWYRLAFISNGHPRDGVPTYGITIQEQDIASGNTRIVTNYIYNTDVKKGSDGIDTVIQGDDEMMFSVTIDRKVISDSASPNFLNFNNSPTAIIDPSKYSF